MALGGPGQHFLALSPLRLSLMFPLQYDVKWLGQFLLQQCKISRQEKEIERAIMVGAVLNVLGFTQLAPLWLHILSLIQAAVMRMEECLPTFCFAGCQDSGPVLPGRTPGNAVLDQREPKPAPVAAQPGASTAQLQQ